MKDKFCIECNAIIKGWTAIRCRVCEDIRKKKETPRTNKSWNWKGKKASLAAIHKHLRQYYGKAYLCENGCLNQPLYEWANISGKYTRNRKDYKMLCRSCHLKLDRKTLAWNKESHLNRKRNKKGQYA